MASLFDVMDRLQELVLSAVTPSGPTTVFGRYVDVAQGWPIGNGVDNAIRANPPRTLVSIFPVPGTTSNPGQIMCWDTQVICPPAHGMIATGTETGFRLDREPGCEEYATVILDGRHVYSYAAVAGDLAETICAGLLSQIVALYPGSTRTNNSLAIVGAFDIVVRIGAPATTGQNLHRQAQQFRIVTWAPEPKDRAAVATAIDLVLKRNLKIAMPDTSTALITYQGLNLDDKFENAGVYRADLIFSVQWDTVDAEQAFEITSVNITLDAGAGLPVTTVQ